VEGRKQEAGGRRQEGDILSLLTRTLEGADGGIMKPGYQVLWRRHSGSLDELLQDNAWFDVFPASGRCKRDAETCGGFSLWKKERPEDDDSRLGPILNSSNKDDGEHGRRTYLALTFPTTNK
jgi:hypothetical protein